MITAEQVLYNLHMELHPNGECKQGNCRRRDTAARLAPIVLDMMREEFRLLLTDLRDVADVQRELAESGNELFQAAAGRLNFVAKYGRD